VWATPHDRIGTSQRCCGIQSLLEKLLRKTPVNEAKRSVLAFTTCTVHIAKGSSLKLRFNNLEVARTTMQSSIAEEKDEHLVIANGCSARSMEFMISSIPTPVAITSYADTAM
jgi:hypothetical protein